MSNLPPGPRGLELLPLIRERARDPLALYRRLAGRYGDLVYFRLGSLRYCLVNDAGAIRRVLQENHANYPKGPGYERLRAFLGQGLLTSEGAHWRRQRKLAAPAFTRERIADFAATAVGLAEELAEDWAGRVGETVMVDAEMSRYALGVVTRTLLGSEPLARANEVRDAVIEVLRHSEKTGMAWLKLVDLLTPGGDRNLGYAIEKRLPTAANRRYLAAIASLSAIVREIIAARKASRTEHADLLGMLMAAREDGTGMSDQELQEEILTIYLAGHETTAQALAWTWHLLSQEPAIEAKMAAECARERGSRFEDLARLEYTHHVFEEAIRHSPPFWRITRRALAEDSLAGFRIPAGTTMIVSPWLTHRNEKYWRDPERFDPSRFEAGERPKYAYLPFGAGPRVCIGSSFTMMEALALLSSVARRVRLERLPGHEVRIETSITLRSANGMPMRVVARAKPGELK